MAITTLLFDLDDTLLGNDMDDFLPPYLRAFAGHVAAVADSKAFVDSLLAGTQAMLANDDPRRTLQQAFSETFYRALNIQPETLAPLVDSFYTDSFPALRAITRPVPAAAQTIRWAFERGFKVVVATNALFPLSAIQQRLDWAGVSPAEFPYTLVTTLEFMHFAKPRPEYFAEILALVDSRPEETLMVGNDWSQDIAPAAALGLHTFWINPAGAAPPANHARPAGVGSLADFLAWAAAVGNLDSLESLPPGPLGVRAQQSAALAAMLEMTRDLSQADWSRRPGAADWSLTEIACHLRDTEIEINVPRLRNLLDDPNTFMSAIDSDPWAAERDYQSQSGPQALAAFADTRRSKIALLDRLTAAEWGQPARHAVFGPTTLQELVAFTVEHDRLHLRQMRENLHPAVL